jgi:hypothetical protein
LPTLGTAESFAVLAGSTATNTGLTVVTGDLGVWPGTTITGFPPGIVIGTTYAGNAVAQQAQSDVTVAYNDLAGRACDADLTGTDLGGLTLTQGVYCFSSAAQLTGQLTLDAEGSGDALFIFQIGSTITTASNSSVLVINGGTECNVYWQVGSSATLGTSTAFGGNILALTSITLNTDTVVSGRVLAQNGAVTMDTNTISNGICSSPSPTNTPVPPTPTNTPVPPTPTNTPVPPTPTSTPVPPTPTNTPISPTRTNTPIPPTNTPIPPTPTNTPIPPTPSPTPTEPPTFVVLTDMDGTVNEDGSVAVNWSTSAEIANAGFNVYRSDSAATIGDALNSDLIASQSSAGSSVDYTYLDATAGVNVYYYWVEAVDLDGSTAVFGPTEVFTQTPTSAEMTNFSGSSNGFITLIVLASLLIVAIVVGTMTVRKHESS